MNELIKTLRQFLYRDLIFVFGGGIVLLSFLGLIDCDKKEALVFLKPIKQFGFIKYFFGVGLSYIIGYLMQEIPSFIFPSVITTRFYNKPGRSVSWIYKRYMNLEFIDLDESEQYDAELFVDREANEQEIGKLERYRNLMMIGTVIGPSFIVSAILLLINAFLQEEYRIHIILIIIFIVFGISLIIFGRIKNCQQAMILSKLYQNHKKIK